MAKAKAPRKPAKAPRKPRAARAGAPFPANPGSDASPEDVWKMIAEAAYFKAKARGFAPGREVEDWIEAEAEVMHRLGRSP